MGKRLGFINHAVGGMCAAILAGCGVNEMPSQAGENASISDNIGYVTESSEMYENFTVDNVYHSPSDGDIHYNVYIPDSYDGSESYALYFTLPGYEGLYFQGAAQNVRS